MKYLKQLAIIFLITILAEGLERILPLPIPATIWGLILLFVLLSLKVIKVEQVREVAMFLIAIMPVMFLPASVALLDHLAELRAFGIAFVLVIILSTVLTFAVAGKVAQNLLKRGE